jgi:acetyl esterase/lipase
MGSEDNGSSSALLVASGRALIEPKLSPNGLFVVFATSTSNGTQLMSIALPDGSLRAQPLGVETVVTVDPPLAAPHPEGGGSYSWFADSKSIAYVAKTGGIFRVSEAGGVGQRLVTSSNEQSLLWSPVVSPNGQFVAFVVDDGDSQSVAISSTERDEIQIVSDGTHADFRCDPAWAGDGHLVWHEWSVPHMPWDESQIVGVHIDGSGSVARRFVVALGSSLSCAQPRGARSGALGWLDDRSGWKNVRVCMDLSSDECITPIEEAFEHGGPTWGPGANSWCFSPDGDAVAFVRNERAYATLCLTPIAAAGKKNASGIRAFQELGRGQHRSISWSTTPMGRQRVAAVRSGAKTPTNIVVYETESSTRVSVARGPVGAWNTFALVEPDLVDWVALDGTTLHGRLYLPNKTDLPNTVAPPPMLVSLHGGPTSQTSIDFNQRYVHWLSLGWAIFVPDYRGSTGWGREYQQAMTHRWGDVDVSDTLSGIHFLVNQQMCDRERIVVMGGSAGGFTALHLLAAEPSMFAGGIALYAVADLIELQQNTHRYERHYNATLVGPFDEAVYQQRSPIHVAENIIAPLLLMHGDADEVVSVGQSQTIAEKLRQRDRNVELVVYPGEGHGWRKAETKLDEILRIDSFLARVARIDT